MLSVVIPTYNYSALPLVRAIHKQCEAAEISYEIIVQDDGSTDFDTIEENQTINKLSNCQFIQNEINLGRAKNINSLLKSAKFDWILLLDCDTKPTSENFIRNYDEIIQNSSSKIVFGGIAYRDTPPSENEVLRWKYGKEREAISAGKRNKNPYVTLLTSNILCQKSVFKTVLFNENITEYGYEDLVFAQQLEQHKIEIHHIENPVFHLNYETSEAFLEKTEKSLQTLLFLEENKIIDATTTKLQKAYQRLKWWKLEGVFFSIFKKWKKKIIQNLLSPNPKLLYFDLYKLGYFIILKSKQ
ncbi:glycosyltransferase [Flavobacterium amnicola]|uniref:Glycosyltransferase n=1 Tax=Flavobacterium amnicola TaxID=2506422 RepID=A0A4Q1K3C4_9FLAO|nr:glycosyltransferase [Flavobacterium amnicola]RXR19269.1 glycosyltransferase [Flavobacterium amnicola]